MRIHRTTPTRSFSTFANALLRDRSISWCAAGVLLYLLSLPSGARASIRSLAEQRKEGRARIADALTDLERSGYLRRVLVKNPETGELSTVYEVFDRPYVDRVTAESAEDGQNLASGEGAAGDTGPLPTGAKTGEQEPPSPERGPDPDPDPDSGSVPVRKRRLPKVTVPEQLRSATELLLSLGRRDPRLTLGTAEAVRLAPLVGEWREAGASDARLREALTGGLPVRVLSAPGILADRLRRKMPARPPRPTPPAPRAECEDCGVPLTPSGACHACAPGPPPPETHAFAAAARRGRALAREALTGGALAGGACAAM
ncbi:hypothetical protein [Streptomyces sp. IB2014 016-6]|uniref:hypothetical protein n=1 Tax=Streptomyces sp. IB2014 016-6 TaxID=2517818 RepID=UPI0011C876B9|nr:hypothetical protein [Streptomyces sp. IB2014 016-6]TXL91915.1 hypothetical protein EW053_06465 [Streptomyces sp. IB2014 016-6]